MDKNTKNEYLTEVGCRIRKVRKERGLRQNQLALLSGISMAALSLIETGKRDLRITSLHRIAVALAIPVADLLEDGKEDAEGSEVGKYEGYDLEDYL